MINVHMYKAEKPVLGARMALGAPRRPPTYRRMLRKKYLAVAKAKKHPTKRTRSLIRVLLCAVKRNKGFVNAYFVNAYFEKGASFSGREGAAQGQTRQTEGRRRPHRGRALLQPRQALLRLGFDQDQALQDDARLHRDLGACSQPVQRKSFFFVFYFAEAVDGVSAVHLMEVLDDTA